MDHGATRLQSVSKVTVYRQQLCNYSLTATGTHVPYGITKCYLPPGTGMTCPPSPQPIKAGTRFGDPGGMLG